MTTRRSLLLGALAAPLVAVFRMAPKVTPKPRPFATGGFVRGGPALFGSYTAKNDHEAFLPLSVSSPGRLKRSVTVLGPGPHRVTIQQPGPWTPTENNARLGHTRQAPQ